MRHKKVERKGRKKHTPYILLPDSELKIMSEELQGNVTLVEEKTGNETFEGCETGPTLADNDKKNYEAFLARQGLQNRLASKLKEENIYRNHSFYRPWMPPFPIGMMGTFAPADIPPKENRQQDCSNKTSTLKRRKRTKRNLEDLAMNWKRMLLYKKCSDKPHSIFTRVVLNAIMEEGEETSSIRDCISELDDVNSNSEQEMGNSKRKKGVNKHQQRKVEAIFKKVGKKTAALRDSVQNDIPTMNQDEKKTKCRA